MSAQSEVIKVFHARRKFYADKRKAEGKGHSYASPLCSADVGANTKSSHTEFGQLVDQFSVATDLYKVKHQKISKCDDSYHAKII
eukprot:2532760-Pyramimonas_sp.AAC.1